MSIQEVLYKLMNQYGEMFDSVYKTQNFKHPFGDFIRKDIALSVSQLESITEEYKVKASCGAGRWTSVPWIAIFDKRITTSAQKGVYIVYLLNKDSKELYLTLNQGATDVSQDSSDDGKLIFTGIAASSSSQTTDKLRQRAKAIREQIKPDSRLVTVEVNSGSAAYDAGSICAIKYTLSNLPDDKQLYADLDLFMSLYKKFFRGLKHNKRAKDHFFSLRVV